MQITCRGRPAKRVKGDPVNQACFGSSLASLYLKLADLGADINERATP
jgi:hypothetical protein